MATGFKKATVTASSVAATQTNFPSYVDLSRLGITTLAEAQSVRVYAEEAKTTEWAREIVSVTEMHVKVPSLTSTVEIYVDWDGSSADYAVADTYGRNAVWSDYRVVMHLQSSVVDSSGTITPTTTNTTFVATSKVGSGAIQFPGANATQNIIANIIGRTITGWGRYTAAGANGYFADARGGLASAYLYLNGGDDTLSFGAGFTSVYLNGSAATTNSTTLAQDTWGYLTLKTSAQWTDTGTDFGMRYTTPVNEDAWPGQMDEIRVTETLDLSSTWITTEYNNQSAESTFWGTWSTVAASATGNFFQFF